MKTKLTKHIDEVPEGEIDLTKPNPYLVFKVIGDIIADREGIKVTLKSVKRKEDQEAV